MPDMQHRTNQAQILSLWLFMLGSSEPEKDKAMSALLHRTATFSPDHFVLMTCLMLLPLVLLLH